MGAETRLNILLTHGPDRRVGPVVAAHPWYDVVADMLAPLGVKTYQATSSGRAMELIEQHPIHLAVVDTRITGHAGLGLLRLIERIRLRATAADYMTSPGEQPTAGQPAPDRSEPSGGAGNTGRRVKVDFGPEAPAAEPVKVRHGEPVAQPAVVWPTIILVTPEQDTAVAQEALKCNVFSVFPEPVDLNLMLDILARAMRRFHQNQWPM